MNRLASLVTALGMGLALVCPPAISADEGDKVRVTAIKGSLHLLQGRGGNVLASIGEDGILLVDDDYPELAAAHREALSGMGESGREPRFVLNTHWHGDHSGGNEFWAERGAVLVAHRNVRQRMGTRQDMKALGRVVEPSPAAALPVVTYGDSLALHFNGDDIEVQHYPRGHTDGDSVIWFSAANVVHMGDYFFKDRFPFVDLGSGGNVLGYIANVEKVLARVDGSTVIVPGHGDLADRSDLERYLDMLKTTSDEVSSALAQGVTLDDLIARGLDEKWSSWGGGFINEEAWIKFIAASL
jgi:glyoxylase-like metal-dependent hydrolase (beta-lactamase superfamily II)